MWAVDFKSKCLDIVDETKKIPSSHLNTVCMINKKNKTCRYIGLGVKGFVCMKNTTMKETLDNLVKEDKIIAKGDNCCGI